MRSGFSVRRWSSADSRSSAAARGRGDTVADCNISTVILLVRCRIVYPGRRDVSICFVENGNPAQKT